MIFTCFSNIHLHYLIISIDVIEIRLFFVAEMRNLNHVLNMFYSDSMFR